MGSTLAAALPAVHPLPRAPATAHVELRRIEQSLLIAAERLARFLRHIGVVEQVPGV